MRRYTVILAPEPDGSAWNVVVPALPGCFTWGATVEEALSMARDAIATHLDGEPVADWPAPEETVISRSRSRSTRWQASSEQRRSLHRPGALRARYGLHVGSW